MEEKEVLVKVEGVSKKFSKDLKTGLKYGLSDLFTNAFGRSRSDQLRPKEFWAVQDVSFELRRGECLGLIGHNGAGKSTLLKMLNGLIRPDTGSITMKGRVGALIELGAGFNPILTGRENIYNNGAVLGFSKSEIDAKLETIIEFAELAEFIDMPVQHYSSGMKVRLGFAVAAQMEPDVLIIDEILAVGDIAFRMKCYNHIINVLSRKVAIILVSHSVVDIMRLCSEVRVLKYGKCIYEGQTEKGIAIYNTLAKTSDEDNSNIQARLLSEDNDFQTGDTVRFEVSVEAEHELKDARLLFHMEFSNIRLSSISTKYTDFNFDLKPGLNTFQFEISKLNLLVGGYMARFELYGPELKDYSGTSNLVIFNIVGPPVNYVGMGQSQIIQLDHKWKNCN